MQEVQHDELPSANDAPDARWFSPIGVLAGGAFLWDAWSLPPVAAVSLDCRSAVLQTDAVPRYDAQEKLPCLQWIDARPQVVAHVLSVLQMWSAGGTSHAGTP